MARVAPLSCPTMGLCPAPVSFPTGQGCAGTSVLGLGEQQGLALVLLSFCSSWALKELWVGALQG